MTWWHDSQGRNLLGGDPPILDDDMILDLLLSVDVALSELPKAMIGLNTTERQRIERLLAENPSYIQGRTQDHIRISDEFQRIMQSPVRDPNRR